MRRRAAFANGFRYNLRREIDTEQTDRQRHDAGENNPITHFNAPNLHNAALRGPLDAAMHTIGNYLWPRDARNRFLIATIWSRMWERDTIYQQI